EKCSRSLSASRAGQRFSGVQTKLSTPEKAMTTRAKRQRTSLHLENLEAREVLSTANIAGGVLEVKGDSWQNSIKITETSSQIRVHIESTPANGFSLVPDVLDKTFTKSSVGEIKVW